MRVGSRITIVNTKYISEKTRVNTNKAILLLTWR